MKLLLRDVWFALSLVLVSSLVGCSPLGRGDDPLHVVPEPVDFSPQQPQSWKLKNGLQVFFVPDSEVPLLQGTLYLRPGSLWEDKFVAVEAMGKQMRLGGAGKYSSEQLDRRLEVLAASIGSSFGDEYGTASFKCLSDDANEVLSLFADVVMRPHFEKQQLSLWQGQALEAISRRLDNPDSVADIAFNQLLFGDTPYGRVPTSSDVRSLTRVDLVRMHTKLVRPDHAILTVSGNISRDNLESLINHSFVKWQPTLEPLPSPPAVSFTPSAGIYFIELPYSQSTILMGQLGVARSSPDYVAFDVFNRVFGVGGFGSLLMERIRTDLGLAYSIHGLMAPGLVKGQNYVNLKTKSDTVGQALIEVVRVVEGLQSDLMPQDELEEKKRSAENSFVFKLASSGAQVERKALLQILGFPDDYDQVYLSKVRSVESRDIQAIANKYWDPKQFIILIVGNDKAYDSLLGSMDNSAWTMPHFEIKKVGFDEKIIW